MTITAWYMDGEDGDQREPHQLTPNEPVSQEILDALGFLSWSNLTGPDDPRLADIRRDRNYNYTDMVTVSPDKLPDYENKIKAFFREHIHYDEEIRFCIEGSGYFDMRDEQDRWIRIAVEGGDMIILPEGSYHRFTCDASNYGRFMRLFVGEPVWTPYNRDEIDEKENASRKKYVDNFLSVMTHSKKARVEEAVFETNADAAISEPVTDAQPLSVTDAQPLSVTDAQPLSTSA